MKWKIGEHKTVECYFDTLDNLEAFMAAMKASTTASTSGQRYTWTPGGMVQQENGTWIETPVSARPFSKEKT